MDDPRSATFFAKKNKQNKRLRLLLLWLAGIDLRLTILAVPPVLPLIHRDLALDEKSVAGVLGLPLLPFGPMAPPRPLLVPRVGAPRASIPRRLPLPLASGVPRRRPSPAAPFATGLL